MSTLPPASGGWKAVYFIQRLISRLAPPLHSLHWKILALLLVAIFVPALYFLWQVRINIERSHLRSTEQGMIDTALVVAETLSSQSVIQGGSLSNLPATREIKRRVFKDLSPDLRIIIYDPKGIVISDTSNQLPPGTDASNESHVLKAIQGRYGARWVRDPNRRVNTLFSTVPVIHQDQVISAVSVVKSTSDVRRSILLSLKDLALPAALAFAMATLTSYLLSSYLTKVITDLAKRADRVAAGEPGVHLETWTKSELGDLARAVEKMRLKLEGKSYVEEMVTTFSHELKTPLAAIRGAAEVLEDDPPLPIREKFLQNIRAEIDRLTQIVNNLLALARIETQAALEEIAISLPAMAREVEKTYARRAESQGLTFRAEIEDSAEKIAVPADQLYRLMEVLLDNAFQFTPAGRAVTLEVTRHTITVSDEGVGIEPALQHKIYDRFMTTVNPVTGRRGTGLGLAIARSIVVRHKGEISMHSQPGAGSRFHIEFPKTS